jgi:hypothetical protein
LSTLPSRSAWKSLGRTPSGLTSPPGGVTFRVGPGRVADAVTIENLDVHGSGTLTRVREAMFEGALPVSTEGLIGRHGHGAPGQVRRDLAAGLPAAA